MVCLFISSPSQSHTEMLKRIQRFAEWHKPLSSSGVIVCFSEQ